MKELLEYCVNNPLAFVMFSFWIVLFWPVLGGVSIKIDRGDDK